MREVMQPSLELLQTPRRTRSWDVRTTALFLRPKRRVRPLFLKAFICSYAIDRIKLSGVGIGMRPSLPSWAHFRTNGICRLVGRF